MFEKGCKSKRASEQIGTCGYSAWFCALKHSYMCVCLCVSGDYSHLCSVESMGALNACACRSVCACSREKECTKNTCTHTHSWLCVNKTIRTTQRAFGILVAKVFTCIVNNDGGNSCGGVRGLPYKVWERKEDRYKAEFESIHYMSFLHKEICCLSFLTT